MILRNVNDKEFVEAEVQDLKENADVNDEYVYIDELDVYISRVSFDAVGNHSDDARVQVETVDILDECPDCGESFKSVEMHISRSDCEGGDE